MAKTINIDISIDEGYVADELRRLANYIEECDEMPTQYETFRAIAEITEEDE